MTTHTKVKADTRSVDSGHTLAHLVYSMSTRAGSNSKGSEEDNNHKRVRIEGIEVV
jgi:hypothetical protein